MELEGKFRQQQSNRRCKVAYKYYLIVLWISDDGGKYCIVFELVISYQLVVK